MAEGFESYDHHVPQQSRRDKLRVITSTHHQTCLDSNNNDSNSLHGFTALVPSYDPSLISSSDLINVHRQSFNLGVKEEGMNLMGFGIGVNVLASTTATDHHHHNMYVDPQLNPNYVYSTGGVLDHHQSSFHGNSSGQSLSLSLSSHHSNNLPLELNLQRYDGPSMFNGGSSKVSGGGGGGYSLVGCGDGGGSSSIELSKSTVPLGPFTGYASVLKGSRFLRPAQQLLEELCDVGRFVYGDKDGANSSLLDPPQLESLSGGHTVVDDPLSCGDGGEQTRKKSKLLSMLDEVYKKYKQYYQQMQGAIASFESVAGLSGAAPFATLALKALSKHFRCLKNAITDQLQFITKSHGKVHCERHESQRIENSSRASYGQRPFHSAGFSDQPVWRPQRGLPERAVTVLRAWLFEHFLHPYPTDTDKLMLAKQTGLSRNQVSNWFINARVRLWKPMVEEIHMLETRQGQKSSQRDDQEAPPNGINDLTECENISTSLQRIGGDFPLPLKRTREDITETTPRGSEGPMKLPYDHNFLHTNPHLGIGVSNAGGVSLTLGLHQNGVGLPEPSYPINAARRFGLDVHGETGYVVSGFGGGQNRQFGRDVMDGQLLHDFVG